jgi:signal transduction histidine kinase
MHRLLWKIFLSFWAALLVFAGVTMFAASHFLESARRQELSSPFERLRGYVVAGQHIGEIDGIEGLKRWLIDLDGREIVPLLLVDREGRDLLGRRVPERVAARIAREANGTPLRPGAHRFAIMLPDQTEYRLIPDFQDITLTRVLRRPRVILLPIVVATLVSGLVGFALARYVTTPIDQLRRATEAYAAGDLDRRVAPALGSRKDEIAELARASDRMAQRLKELMASQRRLLSDISHELRTPLARLQVALGLARQRSGTGAATELDRIETEAEHLNELIGQILSLVRLDVRDKSLEREPVDLADLVAAVAADANFEAAAVDRRVEVTGPGATISGNPALLHSALENVVRNAVRHTAAGTAVAIALEPDAERVRIRIRDRGPGVPEDVLPRLFQPFVRVDDARNRASGGFGLGLAIAQKAVHLHGGDIHAYNAADGGLCVVMELPLAAAGAPTEV